MALLAVGFIIFDVMKNIIDRETETRVVFGCAWILSLLGSIVGARLGSRCCPGWGAILGALIGGVAFACLSEVLVHSSFFFYENYIKANGSEP